MHSLIRNPTQFDAIKALGAQPVVQSIEDSSVSEIAQTILECSPDVVIWSAGAGGGNPERTNTVDYLGAVKAFDAIAESKTRRFIIVSAIDVRDRESKPVPEWYNDDDQALSGRVWSSIGAYMKAKFAADRDLVTNNDRRRLQYTIVRPGGLNNDPAAGTVAAGKVHISKTISREDVAAFIVAAIDEPKSIGMAIDIVGGETEIKQALQTVIDDKIDTFNGYY